MMQNTQTRHDPIDQPSGEDLLLSLRILAHLGCLKVADGLDPFLHLAATTLLEKAAATVCTRPNDGELH
ncbi:MAG: hypothetical protein WA056_01610 [Gallionella sp.]